MTSRAWSLIVVVAFVLTTLPPASSADPPALLAAQEDTFFVGSDANLSFRPDGNGWGRIVLEATEDVALDFALTHDTFEDLRWGGGGEATYRGGTNHTFIHFFEDGEGAMSSPYWFHWWGDPHFGWWPHSGYLFGRCPCDPIELRAGERAILVVADVVGGYSIGITGDNPGSRETVDWTTGEHPGLLVAMPDETRGIDLGSETAGARERSWTTTWNVTAGDVLSASGWKHRSGAGVTASAILKSELGWGTASPAPVGLPGYSLSIGSGGGSSGSKSTRTGPAWESGTYDFFFNLNEARVDTRGEHAGAQFLVLPVGPLA